MYKRQVSSYPAETSIGGFSLTVALDGGLTAPDILVYGTQEWGGLVPGDRVTFEARLKASDLMYGDETTYYLSLIHILIVILVTIFQALGSYLANRMDHRITKTTPKSKKHHPEKAGFQ